MVSIEALGSKIVKFSQLIYGDKKVQPYKVDVFLLDISSGNTEKLETFYLNNQFLKLQEEFFSIFLDKGMVLQESEKSEISKQSESSKNHNLTDVIIDVVLPYLSLSLSKSEIKSLYGHIVSLLGNEKISEKEAQKIRNVVKKNTQIRYLIENIIANTSSYSMVKVAVGQLVDLIRRELETDMQELQGSKLDDQAIILKFYFPNKKVEEHTLALEDLMKL